MLQQKRDDIQWLRAIAIAAVLGFHLSPAIFPFGYLGVDIFFVISGFLMTSILASKQRDANFWEILKNFYGRRISRIFPSYFFVLGLTLVVGKSLLLNFHFCFLSKESLWAVFFGTNVKSLFEAEASYFSLTSEFRFLLHTWSLGVEIQFYLIAPFLLTVIASKSSLFRCFLGIGISLFSHLFFKNTAISFDFFLCRLWQFLFGTFAFYSSATLPPSKNQNLHECGYGISMILLIFLCFGPTNFVINPAIFRVTTTFLTAILIFLGTNMNCLKIPEFWNNAFTYLGDISYSVYLYHWPILLFAKYSGNYNSNNLLNFLGLLIIIFGISIIHYHLFETKLAKLPPSITYSIILILFGTVLCVSLQSCNLLKSNNLPSDFNATESSSSSILLPLNDSEAIRINQEMASNCNQIPIKCQKDALINASFPIIKIDDNFEGRCVLSISPNGTKTAVVLGNSYAMKHIGAIVSAMKASKYAFLFSKVYLVSWKGCPIFESTFPEVPKAYECQKIKGLLNPFLQKLKPSLTFMINRLDFLPSFNTPFKSTDKAFIQFQADFLSIANFSSQSIIIEPHHTVGDTMKAAAITIAQRILQKLSLDGLERNASVVHKELDASWLKMKHAINQCKKCHIFETLKYFCNQSFCETFDKKNRLSYFCDGYHLTEIATQKFIEPLKKLIDTLLF